MPHSLFNLLFWDSLVLLINPYIMRLVQALLTFLVAAFLTAAANAHVRITTPNGGETLQGGQIYQVVWFDLVSHGPAVTYDVEYSADGGVTYLPIVNGLTYMGGNSTYDWLVPNLDITTARIRVTMHVTQFEIYDDFSNADFTISTYYSTYGVGSEVSGLTPRLQMENEPRVGSMILLHVTDAIPGSRACILAGAQQVSMMAGPITILNDHSIAMMDLLPINSQGELHVPFVVPSSLSGVTLNVQVVILSTPNVSSTEGVEFTVLP